VAVGELRAEPQGESVLLSWRRPARNQDGSPLTDLLEFRLFRSSAEPAGAPGEFGPLATVRADAPQNAVLRGDRYAFLDDNRGQGLRPGVRYTYRLQPVNRRGRAGSPAETALTLPEP